ncbi:261_t:CDS:2, partial [Scutellospora calospora]
TTYYTETVNQTLNKSSKSVMASIFAIRNQIIPTPVYDEFTRYLNENPLESVDLLVNQMNEEYSKWKAIYELKLFT